MINQKIKATLRTKGKCVPQQVVQHELQYNDFKKCLRTGDIQYNDFHTIRSINHDLHTFRCNKISFNSYDNKRYMYMMG